MLRFSANLGMLWANRSLPDAIFAAKAAGFDAVECHWPYSTDPEDVRSALKETNLRMLSLNTRRGDHASGDFGLGADAEQGRASVIEAADYARAIDAQSIHVMPGVYSGPKAWKTFTETLDFACEHAAEKTILVEPLNPHDVPGYLLGDLDAAVGLIESINRPNLKLMFDFYHIGRMNADPIRCFRNVRHHIGHIQFASVPDRGKPGQGSLDYQMVFSELLKSKWSKPLGAEYRPVGKTDASLVWMQAYKDARDD